MSLIVSDLVKTYGNRTVVDHLSLRVDKGEIVGILGPNGAGKTTAFHMMIGLLCPDRGSIDFAGHSITHLPMYQRARLGLGYLPQEPSTFRELSVEKNIMSILELVEPNYTCISQRITDLLNEFGLEPFRHCKAGTLSGGERRRLEIARAIASDPTCLMLDEPFANIDPLATADLKKMIHMLKERGISLLITDHNARELVSIVDRGYLIADGRVLRSGTAQELLTDAQARARYFGEGFTI